MTIEEEITKAEIELEDFYVSNRGVFIKYELLRERLTLAIQLKHSHEKNELARITNHLSQLILQKPT